jgi:hypothetical protein
MKRQQIGLLLLVFLLTGSLAAAPDRSLLFWIPADAIAEARQAAPGLALMATLPDGSLVRAGAAELEALLAAGRPPEVLDGFDPNRPLYLVRVLDAEDWQAVYLSGEAVPVSADTFLFQPADGQTAREVLPARAELRALSVHPWPDPQAPPPVLPERLARAPLAANPLITQIVNQVSPARLQASIQTLQDFGTRKANNENNGCTLAGDYILSTITAAGVSASFDPFPFLSYTSRNVVATLPGALHPEKVVILCAHYDSTSHIPGQAPGADDNASGTAVVMEAARLFAGRPFDCTVKFIAFSAEEYGLYGSNHYATEAYARGEQIMAVLNMDMIGFVDQAPEDLDLIGNPASAWLVQTVTATAPLYVNLGYKPYSFLHWSYSDHAPFWNYHYSAFCAIEDESPANPNYHSPTDTIDTLDFDFLTRSAQAMVAVGAHLAGPLPSAGDLNRDGAVDAVDAVLLAGYLVEDQAGLPEDGGSPDLNGDSRVNVLDLLLLERAIAN